MSLIKRWLEEVSDDMGHGGEINDEVLAEGNRRMAHMGRAMELKEAQVHVGLLRQVCQGHCVEVTMGKVFPSNVFPSSGTKKAHPWVCNVAPAIPMDDPAKLKLARQRARVNKTTPEQEYTISEIKRIFGGRLRTGRRMSVRRKANGDVTVTFSKVERRKDRTRKAREFSQE